MIRLIQRRLIIPRGDTGKFTVPLIATTQTGDISVFTIFDQKIQRKIFEKIVEINGDTIDIIFSHADTVNLPVGNYVWDIKFYSNPVFADGALVDGIEVDSYYGAFTLPICEVRQTGDNLLFADDAPTSIISPGSLNVITAAISEANSAKRESAASATSAANSVTEMAALVRAIPTKVSEFENDAGYLTQHQDISGKANSADLAAVATSGSYNDLSNVPTNVSSFTNDAGYLTQHQDISGKANSVDLATVATSGSYNDLSNKPFIPSAVSDLTDDSGHYTKPVGGIPASDLANGVLDIWSGLTYHTSTMSTDSDSFVLGGATDAPTEINKCLVTSTPGANIIPKFDYQGRLHSVTPEEEWDGSNAVATTEYVDNMISDNMPEIPTNVSELNNDAGYLTSYTETDPTVPSWAKAAQKPTYTAQEVGALPADTVIPTVPTNVSAFTNDAGYLTSFTETDPTVPSWAKAVNKPTYTAAEVGAPTVAEMNTAISTAIGNVHQFDIQIVQALPTENIQEHTIYFVPKTGETNDVYDEYIRVNNAWEMIGNTQIDLSNYVQKTDYATNSTAGIVIVDDTKGVYINSTTHKIELEAARIDHIKAGTQAYKPITPARQQDAVFYGLATAAGDTTQKSSSNAVGTYTTEAKAAIRSMLGAAASTDIPSVPVTDVQINGTSVLNNGVANVPMGGTDILGVLAVNDNGYYGIYRGNTGTISINKASSAQIRVGNDYYKPIVPVSQHESTFYGLAKAAGDSTQSASSNAVGTYTTAAATAIKTMLQVQEGLEVVRLI